MSAGSETEAAILFRLQSDEWRRTSELLRGVLADRAKPPLMRLRALVHAFIRSECEEAAIRSALSDAAPLYRDAPEAQDARAAGEGILATFMREALPMASEATRALAGELIKTTLGEVGKRFSETPRTEADDDWAWFWAGEPGRAQSVALHKGPLLFEEHSPLQPGERFGRVHFAFDVAREELESAVDRVRHAGVEVYGPTDFEWMRARSYYFYDPDGNLVEFWSPDPD